MASYGAVGTHADLLGEEEAMSVLQETLDEEGEADDRLTTPARKSIHPAARA
jgi:ferritin-like metal-binding protein YciE